MDEWYLHGTLGIYPVDPFLVCSFFHSSGYPLTPTTWNSILFVAVSLGEKREAPLPPMRVSQPDKTHITFDKLKPQTSAPETLISVGNHCLQAPTCYTNVLLPTISIGARQLLEEGTILSILCSLAENHDTTLNPASYPVLRLSFLGDPTLEMTFTLWKTTPPASYLWRHRLIFTCLQQCNNTVIPPGDMCTLKSVGVLFPTSCYLWFSELMIHPIFGNRSWQFESVFYWRLCAAPSHTLLLLFFKHCLHSDESSSFIDQN